LGMGMRMFTSGDSGCSENLSLRRCRAAVHKRIPQRHVVQEGRSGRAGEAGRGESECSRRQRSQGARGAALRVSAAWLRGRPRVNQASWLRLAVRPERVIRGPRALG
jgi:hypothetical protein